VKVYSAEASPFLVVAVTPGAETFISDLCILTAKSVASGITR
jgi:hypothetical protein